MNGHDARRPQRGESSGDRNAHSDAGGVFKPLHVMLEEEIRQATGELQRRLRSLLISATSAGFAIGASVLLIAFVMSSHGPAEGALGRDIVIANLYAVGFVIVILGRMDLFTEFTTIAVMPVLRGRAGLGALVRFWATIYLGNLAGAALFALLLAELGPSMNSQIPEAMVELAADLINHGWWTILLSAALAGYLMGVLSWLIVGGRDSISQIVFIWMIAFTIGFAHLHHSIIGAIEVFSGAMMSDAIAVGDVIYFLSLATAGNAIGGVVFAASMHFSIARHGRGEHVEGARR